MSTKTLGKKPLFTKKEIKAKEDKLAKLDKQYRAKKMEYKDYSPQRSAIENAFTVTKVRRAQERAEEFLNGLLTLTGSHGGTYLTFEWAFNYKDAPDITEVEEIIAKGDTPESRRSLYTILRALTEVPKTWGTSAFIRFLRGMGKQKGSKYHGAGTFGTLYGWKEREVKQIADIITGGSWYSNPYCQVLMSYADMYDEISQASNDDYEINVDARNYATHVERDIDFLNKLCKILEERGLGPVPTPAAAKPKKIRKSKVFKSGDIIRKSNLRDLPLPAHVRLNIDKYDADSEQWLPDTLEQVVTSLTNHGQYHCHYVMPGTTRAYPENIRYSFGEYKNKLEGATYLGPWKGQLVKGKEMKINFSWRERQDG
jgi:cobalamin biosynthesis Mg chelatase CobN